MGHSRMYAFDGRLIVGTREMQVGIDTLKQARSFLSEANERVNGFKVDKVILWAQTARAKRFVGAFDYAVIHREGAISLEKVETGKF